MRYLLIICDDESDGRSPTELVSDPEHVSWVDYIDRHGVAMLEGVRLRPSSDATTVAMRDGEALISDGPFVETKEQIGGVVIIECANLDEALEVASRHPFASHGVIEVRPVWDE
ncbi:MAG TPA: YciI family protein [Acidimicrobiales bacterium]